MVGEQGRHIRHGQCPILLGTPGSPSTQGPLRTFPSSGLELRLCLWLLRSEGAVNLAVALLAALLALGTPLSWKKTHLAEVNTWLGFVVHPNILQVLMAANKHILEWRSCSMSAGEVDASATLGLEDGHHHGGETRQGGQDAGVHAAVPLQHALRPVLPLLAEVLLVGLQRC